MTDASLELFMSRDYSVADADRIVYSFHWILETRDSRVRVVMNVFKAFGPIALAVLFVTVGSLSGCAEYKVVRTECNEGKIRVALADRRTDVLAVRLSNSGTERMYVKWKDAHLRWPDGYEAPVNVIPGDALTSIYPGGTVEYHLKPAHTYVPRDRIMYRRHSLTESLFPQELFEAHADDYKLKLFLPVCKGEPTEQGSGEKKNCVVWKIQTTVARH